MFNGKRNQPSPENHPLRREEMPLDLRAIDPGTLGQLARIHAGDTFGENFRQQLDEDMQALEANTDEGYITNEAQRMFEELYNLRTGINHSLVHQFFEKMRFVIAHPQDRDRVSETWVTPFNDNLFDDESTGAAYWNSEYAFNGHEHHSFHAPAEQWLPLAKSMRVITTELHFEDRTAVPIWVLGTNDRENGLKDYVAVALNNTLPKSAHSVEHVPRRNILGTVVSDRYRGTDDFLKSIRGQQDDIEPSDTTEQLEIFITSVLDNDRSFGIIQFTLPEGEVPAAIEPTPQDMNRLSSANQVPELYSMSPSEIAKIVPAGTAPHVVNLHRAEIDDFCMIAVDIKGSLRELAELFGLTAELDDLEAKADMAWQQAKKHIAESYEVANDFPDKFDPATDDEPLSMPPFVTLNKRQ